MVLAPSTTALSVVRTTSGTTGDLSDETMSELNLTSVGYPRYSVYQISDAAKRYLARTTVPTFQYDAAGGSTWVTLTPTEIQYAGGCIVLSTPLTSAAVVRCHTGKYFTTITDLLGGSVARITNGPTLVETPLLGDAFINRYPTIKDFNMTLDTFVMKVCASYSTSGGSNKDLTFTHVAGGTAGNAYTIAYTDPGLASQSIAVTATGTAISVSLATNGSKTITSTALEVMNAVNQSPVCRALNFAAELKTGSTGVGVVAAFGAASLYGGLDPADHTAKFGVSLIVQIYFSTSADSRLEGYAYLESIDGTLDPKDVIKQNLTFKGNGPLYYRTS
jgi:hypothetical protein